MTGHGAWLAHTLELILPARPRECAPSLQRGAPRSPGPRGPQAPWHRCTCIHGPPSSLLSDRGPPTSPPHAIPHRLSVLPLAFAPACGAAP